MANSLRHVPAGSFGGGPGKDPGVPGYPPAYAPARDGDIGDLLRKLWRRKWIVAACGAAALALAAVVTALLPARYTAVAQVRVGLPETNVADFRNVVEDTAADSTAVQTETYVMRSRDLIGRTVDRLDLESVPELNPALREPSLLDRLNPARFLFSLVRTESREDKSSPAGEGGAAAPRDREREAVISNVLARLEIYPMDRSRVIAVGFQSRDPERAARIANAVSTTYVEYQRDRKVATTERANAWLENRIANLRGQVKEDERAIADFRRTHDLYETRADTVTAQQIAELNTQLTLARAKMAEAEARLNQARANTESADGGDAIPEVLSSPLIQALRQQQATAEQRAAELSANYGEKHPKMRNALAEIEEIRQKIRREVSKIVSGLRNEAETARARYQALRQNLDSIKNVAASNNQDTVALRALEREAEASRALYERFLARAKETDAQLDIQQSDAEIVSQAALPGAPSFPPVTLLFAVALLGGVAGGILLVLLIERLDVTFRVEDEIEEQTGLPSLAVVPRVSRRELSRHTMLRRPGAPFSEAMRKLDITLRLDTEKAESKTVMMASAAPNEGKTGICLSLARMAASSGLNAIVVDCDWRRPQLHTLLGRPNKLGLGQLLTGRTLPEDVVYRDGSGAHLIFAGRISPRHVNLLCSDRMRYLLQSLARHYDLVLIDTPPVLVGAEVLNLARMVDQVVYVVRWGHTPRDEALRGLRQLDSAGGPIAGFVLSQVDVKRYRQYAHRNVQDYPYRPAAAARAA